VDVQFSRCEIIKICGFSIHLVRVGSKVVTSLRGPSGGRCTNSPKKGCVRRFKYLTPYFLFNA